ncbi:MAG: D-alanyl-D-alanine carboxypeptidase [Clostridium sp.]|nr:D-alanyl-D-alanine carboxypeptidase [Clostridium sp.]
MKENFKKAQIVFLLLIFLFPSTLVKADMPTINGQSAITYDLESDEIILSKNPDERLYPASITKLLTALVFSDNYSNRKTEYLKYPKEARLEYPYSLYYNLRYINNDELISADTIMHALLVGSANDSAVVIALNISDSIEDFAVLMNEKAKELGMLNSNFVTTTGIHNDEHYSTASDLMILTKAAYKDPWIREVSLVENYSAKTKTQTLGEIETKNKILGIDGNVFGKTGFTYEAGRCLTSIFERNGRKIGTIILNSKNDPGNIQVFNDTRLIADASYNENPSNKYLKGDDIEVFELSYKPYKFFGKERKIEIPLVLSDNISYYPNDVNENEGQTDITFYDIESKEIDKDTPLGQLTYKERFNTKTVDLLSTVNVQNTILKNHLLGYILITLFLVIFIFLVLKIMITNRRKKKERKRRLLENRRNSKFSNRNY